MSREVISTPNGPAAVGPYSQAIKANGFVFVSGQLGLVPETKQFAGDTVAAQTEQVLKNISAILQAAGSSMAQVVKVTVLLADMAAFAEMNAVYATFFPNDPPARVTFAVKGLPLNGLVEIEVMALA
ncbi:MAG: reactive intermediate/imine deaminase [Chloroflexi bacterium]|nr:reactive intermediate/imine deaminase [Chloroflexota bacterium]